MHLSASVVVVQIHERSAGLFAFCLFPRVDEQLGEGASVGRVVWAPGPLEAAATDAATDATNASPGDRAGSYGRSLTDGLVAATAV